MLEACNAIHFLFVFDTVAYFLTHDYCKMMEYKYLMKICNWKMVNHIFVILNESYIVSDNY